MEVKTSVLAANLCSASARNSFERVQKFTRDIDKDVVCNKVPVNLPTMVSTM